MMRHVEQMDQLRTAMAREMAALTELEGAEGSAQAARDARAAEGIREQIHAKRAYLAFLREQFDRRLN